jgi:hypothetical protein
MSCDTLADPQVNEDERINRVRRRTEVPVAEPIGQDEVRTLILIWHRWAANCQQRAAVEHVQGDEFAALLLRTRATIREAAATLLLSHRPSAAAAEMMVRVQEHLVRTPPLIGYDDAAVHYTIARSWQWCAHQIDPTLPEIQPRWS